MLFVKLLGFLRGYITVRISGQYPERLINICVARGMFLWNILKGEDGSITACMSIKGFHKMPSVAKKAGCRIRITGRHGLPFILHRHRRRYVFGCGIMLFFIACYVLSLFIWKIEIIGGDGVDKKALMSSLAKHGLHTGVYRGSVNSDLVKRGVMTDLEEIAWVGVVINGSGAEVEVRKRVPKPDVVDKHQGYNLIATHDGVVTALNISRGVSYIKVGSVVYKGQLLVSGVIESNLAEIWTTHAAGTVTATTWREKTGVIPREKVVRTRTGKTKSKHTFEMFGWNIPLFFSDKVSFKEFDRVSRVNKLWENSKFNLPFSFHYDKFYDVTVKRVKISREEGINIIKKQLEREIEAELPRDAVIKDVTHTVGTDVNGEPTLTVLYECSENIAQEKEALYEPFGEDNGSGANGGDN